MNRDILRSDWWSWTFMTVVRRLIDVLCSRRKYISTNCLLVWELGTSVLETCIHTSAYTKTCLLRVAESQWVLHTAGKRHRHNLAVRQMQQEEAKRSVFVRNFPKGKTSGDDLRRAFEVFGPVKKVVLKDKVFTLEMIVKLGLLCSWWCVGCVCHYWVWIGSDSIGCATTQRASLCS